VVDQVEALEGGDFAEFLKLVIESGYSSWRLCQNIFSCTNVHDQGLAIALAMSENIFRDDGAWRVHGGGFAGTIQAFVRKDFLEDYVIKMEKVFGQGSCHTLSIRSKGTTWINSLVS
jgi:galactokinase